MANQMGRRQITTLAVDLCLFAGPYSCVCVSRYLPQRGIMSALAEFGNWRLAPSITGRRHWLGAQGVEYYQIDQILLLGPPSAHTTTHTRIAKVLSVGMKCR